MAAIELPQLQEATKKTAGIPTVFETPGSPGRIRTCDTLINSQLRYHCATGELDGCSFAQESNIQDSADDARLNLNFLRMTADEDSYLRII